MAEEVLHVNYFTTHHEKKKRGERKVLILCAMLQGKHKGLPYSC